MEERNEFVEFLKIKNLRGKDSDVCSFWWPDRAVDDPSSAIIEG